MSIKPFTGQSSGATGQSSGVTIKTIDTTTYTLLLSDVGKLLEFTAATPVSVTIPPQSTTTFTGNEEFHLCQAGDGKVTVVYPGVALALPATQLPSLSEKDAIATVKRRAEDSWRMFGLLEAV